MDPLYKKAIAQGIAGMALLVAFIFLNAGTWHYWQGWLFITVFSVSTIGFTVYLALYDRPLLERRINAGPPALPVSPFERWAIRSQYATRSHPTCPGVPPGNTPARAPR
jgi:hypothetical protein